MLKIDEVILDLENPRISRSTSQREALQKIIEDQDVKLLALAESITEEGLNPMDRLLVIKAESEVGKWTVIEGNRRLAALKILSNPAVLAGLEVRPAVQKRFEALAHGWDRSITKLDCFELASRAEGAAWIKQRHTGENEGRGIVDWGGVASARFRGNDPALQALDLVLKHGGLTDDEKNSIETGFPITTLDRLLSTPAVRSAIGLVIEEQKLRTALPPEEVIKTLTRIVRDLANKTVNVTGLKKKDQQVAYVDKLGPDLPDLSKANGPTRAVDGIDASDFAPKPVPKPKAAPKKPDRKTLIPKGCALNVTNAKISEIVRELRGLSLKDNPHAISVLFRVFLEQSVDDFLTRKGSSPYHAKGSGGTNFKKLRDKVTEAVAIMEQEGTPKKDLDGVSKGIADKDNPLCAETLNNYVHNRFYSPLESHLKVSWDNAQRFFELIWP
jgi:hypothetical protein